MSELAMHPNIGKILDQKLDTVGIRTYDQLKKTGSKKAWLLMKAFDDSICINCLYALDGAIRGIRKIDLPEDVKNELKDYYNAHK